MKNMLYFAIPAIVFLLILTNAFYGHMLFASSSEQVVNKYSAYIHLQPEWESNNKNLIFEVTNSWYKHQKNSQNNPLQDKDIPYNENQLQYVNNKSFVELKHSFSDCEDKWQPILYRKAIDTVRHEMEYMQGLQLSTDPNVSVYPDTDGPDLKQQSKIKNGYAQFIPICTQKESTSYDYSIRTDNDEIGFDVYFISSISERDAYFTSNFNFNDNVGCFAFNKKSYTGACSNIEKDGGLLIIIPDELKPWLTKVTVNLYEKEN